MRTFAINDPTHSITDPTYSITDPTYNIIIGLNTFESPVVHLIFSCHTGKTYQAVKDKLFCWHYSKWVNANVTAHFSAKQFTAAYASPLTTRYRLGN